MLQEELDLKPGHSFLDVGSGCGIIAACAAYLVSPPPPRHTCAHTTSCLFPSTQHYFRRIAFLALAASAVFQS